MQSIEEQKACHRPQEMKTKGSEKIATIIQSADSRKRQGGFGRHMRGKLSISSLIA